MKKTYYSAPQAEWLEAENATCFLEQSPNGEIPALQDGGWGDIEW